MAFTQILRRRPPCLLHVEPLEIRCLLTGQSPWPAAPLALTSDLGATALVSQPASLSLTLDNQTTAADSPDPAMTDNSSSTGDIQTTSADSSSSSLTDSSSTQGDVSQAASDDSAGASSQDSSATGQDSGAGDPTTGQAQDSSVETGLGSIQAVQSTVVSADPIVDQTVTVTPIPDVVAVSSTVVPINPNNQQGGDSGSGTGGDDSGSSGGDSGTTTTGDQSGSDSTSQDSGTTATGDQGTGTNLQTAPINPGSRAANVVTRVDGPEPGRPAPSNSGEDTAANTGNNPAPNPSDSGPATPPAVTAAAPKPAGDSAPRLSSVLIQEEAAKTGQRIVSLDVSSAHTDSSRPAEARESGDGTGEKQAEGIKGNFTVEEAPPAAESETPVTRTPEVAPGVEEPDAGPMETPALVRDLPSAGAVLLAAAAPFDLPALEKGVHGFFAQLEQMGEQIVAAQDRTGVGPWLVALATAGVALEVARRKLKPAPGDLDAADGGSDPTWNWLVAPDPG